MGWCYNLIFPIQLIYFSSTIYWISLPPFTDIWALSCTYFMCVFLSISNLYILLWIYLPSLFSAASLLITLIFYYFLISKRKNTSPWYYFLKSLWISSSVDFSNEPGNHFVSMALWHLQGGDQAVGNKQYLSLSSGKQQYLCMWHERKLVHE